MIELDITRHNPLIDPTLHAWSWEIPVYLFLGGWVAGMMIINGYFLFRGERDRARCVCTVLPAVGLVLLSAGMLALFLDLEHKLYVWRLYTTFVVRSPMSWGAWILVLVYPTLVAALLVRPPSIAATFWAWPAEAEAFTASRPQLVRAVGVVNIGLGIALGIYTGVLLSALGARPLWSSAMLGPLFLFSGLSAAAAFVHLIARREDERQRLMKADLVFLGLEALAIALLLIGLATATEAQAQAAALLLGGAFTAVFWVFVVGIGIAVPFAVQMLALSDRVAHTPVTSLLVMVGSLALRFVIVYAGQYSHWVRG